MKRRVFVGSATYLFLDGIAKLVQLGVMLWVARQVSKETYGQVGILLAAQQFLMMLLLGGLPDAVPAQFQRIYSSQRAGLYALCRSILIKRTVIIAVLAAFAWAILAKLNILELHALTAVSVFVTAGLFSLNRVHYSIRQLEERHKAAAASKNGMFSVSFLGAAVGVSMFPEDAGFSFFAASALAMGAFALFEFVQEEAAASYQSASATRKNLEIESSHYLLPQAIGWFFGYGFNIIVGGMVSSTSVANFTLAFLIASGALLVLTAVQQAWAPRFYAEYGRASRERIAQLNSTVWGLSLFGVAALGGAITLYWTEISYLLGGNLVHYSTLGPFIALLFAAHVIHVTHYAGIPFILAENASTQYSIISLTSTLLGLLSVIILVRLLGELGAFIGYVSAAAIRGFSVWMLSALRFRCTFPWRTLAAACALLALPSALALMGASITVRSLCFVLALVALGAPLTAQARILAKTL